MTLAVRGIVEPFRLVNRVEELHRKALTFSVSHDHETVRIYGHVPVIKGTKITYWRYPLRKYEFTERKGMEKWSAYRFMKNVYDIWMPTHFKRISSALTNCLPNRDFELSLGGALDQACTNMGATTSFDSLAALGRGTSPSVTSKARGRCSWAGQCTALTCRTTKPDRALPDNRAPCTKPLQSLP